MDNKKKSITILVIGIIALLLVVGGATYAYFVATGGTPKDMDITVTTNTVDKLDFQVGDDINIFASPDNFGNGQGNQSGNSYARAILTPNNKTNTATAHYYMYLNITKNELEYTTALHKAELMLTVTDGDDNIVTIADLPEVKDGDNNVIGYDITEEEGLITILNNHEIVATGTKTENWNVTVTFINLPDNQNDNTGKLFTAKVLIQEEKIEFFASYIVNQFQSNTNNTNGLYLHNGTITSTSVGLDEEGTILDSEDGSYRYSGGDYKLTTLATNHEPVFTRIEDNLITVTCGGRSTYIGETCTTADQKYYLGYEEEGARREFTTYKAALDAAVTDGYLTADNIKNYVCFGYDGEYSGTCAADNLYRIIGVFGSNVKLIKADLADTNLLEEDFDYQDSETAANTYTAYRGNLTNLPDYYWSRYNSGYTGTPNYDTVGSAYKDTTKYNVWSYSYLNQKNLNTNYLNNIGTKWASMITKTIWNNNKTVTTNAKAAYNADYASATSPYNYVNAKIGLMYVSDYAYGADPSNWVTTIESGGYDNAKVTSENWLYNGVLEWTISRVSNSSAYRVLNAGGVNNVNSIVCSRASGVRPVFNLLSSVTYDGGTGTATDPYRIK